MNPWTGQHARHVQVGPGRAREPGEGRAGAAARGAVAVGPAGGALWCAAGRDASVARVGRGGAARAARPDGARDQEAAAPPAPAERRRQQEVSAQEDRLQIQDVGQGEKGRFLMHVL